jgi:polyhydroxybutyrate depolymerase
MIDWKCAAIVLALLGAACASRGGESASAPQSRLCSPAAIDPGLSDHTIQSGGVARTFKLYVPASLDARHAAPLVIDLHGTGGSPEGQLRVSRLREAADARGFIVMALAAAVERPNNGGFAWNVPSRADRVDDVRYTEDAITAVSALACIDDTRIYAIGYSGGARLASELACRLPGRFAAISAVAGLRHPRGEEGVCLPEGGAVSVIAFHGDADRVNRYELDPAAPNPTWTYGIEEAVSRWAEALACGPAERSQASAAVTRLRYQCRDGAELAFYSIEGGGHTWPGNDVMAPAMGPVTTDIDATDLSLDFFEARRRTP